MFILQMFIFILTQWFSPGVILSSPFFSSTPACLALSGHIFGYHNYVWGAGVKGAVDIKQIEVRDTSEILQCVGGKHPIAKNYSTQNVHGAMVEKPCFNWILAFSLLIMYITLHRGISTTFNLGTSRNFKYFHVTLICCRYLETFLLIYCFEIKIGLH